MKVYLIAGEDSGDLHSSNLIKSLKRKYPQVQARGVGGDKMREQGTELVAHVKDINFMGFVEIVKNLSTIRRLFRTVEDDIKSYQPDLVILVDYPGFNLRMAKYIKTLGIPVLYYISPQVWAWKKGRVNTIRDYTENMMVILPFEEEFYAKEGVSVNFVGHPLLDVIEPIERPQPQKNGLIALLPGSRKQEISRILPAMLEVVPHFPDFSFCIGGAPSQERSFYEGFIQDMEVDLVMNQTYDLLRRADYALVTSGTATLETALFKVPQVVVYKGSGISFAIGKRLVQVDFISLVNLIVGREVVKELIQNDFNLENTLAALQDMMQPVSYRVIQDGYHELREKLGSEGASQRAATVVGEMLGLKTHEG